MARMLTEEEVRRMEEQRELRDRARAAGNPTAGMDWNERRRFEEAQERQMWDQRFRETHGGLSRAEVAAGGPNGSGRQYAAIKRGFELQAARQNEMEKLGRELATREEEARQKRFGMAEQGMEAAKQNREAAIRAAELQTAGAAQVAGINRDRDLGVAKLNAESAEKINEGKNKTAVKVAKVNYETGVDTAQVQARAQEARTFAENMMKNRQVDEKAALEFAQKRSAMITQLINSSKVRGKPKYTEEQAEEIIDRRLQGQLPGTLKKFQR